MQDAGWIIAGSGTIPTRRSQQIAARLAVVVAFVLTAGAARADAPSKPTSAETVVRVYATAVVTADQVTLADIASISGEEAQMAGAWAITQSPAPGKEAVLELRAVQSALVRRGINASHWVFRGSSRCRISRPMPSRVTSTEPASSDSAELSKARSKALRMGREYPTTLPAFDQPAAPSLPNPDTLEGAIYAHLSERLASLGGRPAVQMSSAFSGLLKLSKPAYEFRITDRSERSLGLVPLEVAVYHDGKLDQIQSMLAEVALVKSVVVSRNPINRGQIIHSDDVELREQRFDHVDKNGIADLNIVLGQRAVRFINKDELLGTRDFEPVPLIMRNDLVTVVVQHGGINIRAVAKAMAAASYGQLVELRNESSKESFVARVTGPKTAELVFGAAPVPAAVSLATPSENVGGSN